jgi:hypothetical protein
MGSGGFRGLQTRSELPRGGLGGFDSHTPPPFFQLILCTNFFRYLIIKSCSCLTVLQKSLSMLLACSLCFVPDTSNLYSHRNALCYDRLSKSSRNRHLPGGNASRVLEYMPIGCPAGSRTKAMAPVRSVRLKGNPDMTVPPSSFDLLQLA